MRDIEHRGYLAHSKTITFHRHVDFALREVEKASRSGNAIVSTSWGKDSVALCHLALGLPMVHLQSPYELPGGEHVVQWFIDNGAEIHTVRTRKSLQEYIDWLREFGLGYERESHAKVGRTRKASEVTVWATEHGYDVNLLGMRAEESAIRRRLFRKRGATYQRVDERWISNPLAWWSVRDVWAYLVSRDLPWHRLYDCESFGVTREKLRNCGWLTVQGDITDWRIPWLRRHFPDEFERLSEHFPRVGLIG